MRCACASTRARAARRLALRARLLGGSLVLAALATSVDPCAWLSPARTKTDRGGSLGHGAFHRRTALLMPVAVFASAEVAHAAKLNPWAGREKEQVAAASKKVDDLRALECWEDFSCDGDEIRRYLGTVGTASPLFLLDGALKILYADLDIDQVPDLEELLGTVRQADYLAYSTLFAVGSGGMDPKPYMRDCLKQVERLQTDLRALTKALPI
mmetsp:Transcript_3357/g.10432  ORF Transcript_3357/g.10432 Transcript_3357/m.10432 type:complete len:212 (+) Transcript_3357:47-682(+)